MYISILQYISCCFMYGGGSSSNCGSSISSSSSNSSGGSSSDYKAVWIFVIALIVSQCLIQEFLYYLF